MNLTESTVEIDNRLVNVVEIDWEKRNWTRIYTPDEERERAEKMRGLNGGPYYNPATERLLAASSKKRKTTFRIKHFSSRLQGASSITKERKQKKL
jgi:hypothetical protein